MPVAAKRVDHSYRLYLARTTPCPNRESPKNDDSVFYTATPGVLPEPALKHLPRRSKDRRGSSLSGQFLALDCWLQLRSIGQLRCQEVVSALNGLTAHPREELFILIYNMVPFVIPLNSQLCSIAVSVN